MDTATFAEAKAGVDFGAVLTYSEVTAFQESPGFLWDLPMTVIPCWSLAHHELILSTLPLCCGLTCVPQIGLLKAQLSVSHTVTVLGERVFKEAVTVK